MPLFIADRKISGILPSVSLAQFILESDFGKSELAQNTNNVFGMKNMLSENNWPGSSWDGVSIYVKETTEEYEPGVQTVKNAKFRKTFVSKYKKHLETTFSDDASSRSFLLKPIG